MNFFASVRLASSNDAEELSRLNQEFNGGLTRPPAKIIERLNTNQNELVAVAELFGTIVGFGCAQILYSFCYDQPYGEITELYVQEAARRQRLAIAIIACLEENLKERGVKRMQVLTGRGNNAAISTYEHCHYYKHDEQLLIKSLEDPANGKR